MTLRVLLLGGTGEARRLAALLDGSGRTVISSLAGRVSAPRLPAGEVRVGGFGGPAALADWLVAERIDAVIDATHPFAARITATAATVTGRLGLPLLILRRPGWAAGPGDRWHRVPGLAEAAGALPGLGRRAFLTVGRLELAAFADLAGMWFLIRSVDPPQPPLPADAEIVLDRGPFPVDGELALLRTHRIDVVVTKDSGGSATAAKLAAARRLGIPVVMVNRPPLPDGVRVVAEETAAVRWLENA